MSVVVPMTTGYARVELCPRDREELDAMLRTFLNVPRPDVKLEIVGERLRLQRPA